MRADLGRIEALTSLLNDPQLTYPTIHIAGTNGKTSTGRMIAFLLAGHGLTAGLYTSPHLQSVRERLVRFGLRGPELTEQMISEEWFGKIFDYLRPFVEMVEAKRGEDVTYFELTTAMAYEWMSDAAVDVGVLEAGMGGRWDATNLVRPRVAVLTEIAVDHQKFLGSTPLENAKEKVGIIKPGTTVVTAAQLPEVAELIAETADDGLHRYGDDFGSGDPKPAVGGSSFAVEGIHGGYRDVFLPLFGKHQARNFGVAVAACEAFLERALDEEIVKAVASSMTMPGRMEVVSRDPLIVVDGAHNPAGAKALAAAMGESFGERHRTLVVSILSDKDSQGVLEALLPLADRVIFTRTDHGVRPVSDPSDLAEMAGPGVASEVVADLKAAIARAVDVTPEDGMVLVTGSLYGVGEAREVFRGKVA